VKQDENKIFVNPSGFIEQHFVGHLSPEAILSNLKQIEKYSKKQAAEGKKVLILEDLSKITKIEYLNPKMSKVRKESARTMKDLQFHKIAVYGPLQLQVIVNTMALVAGKRSKVQVFDNRISAIEWLLSKR
jgi:hypothetical protein